MIVFEIFFLFTFALFGHFVHVHGHASENVTAFNEGHQLASPFSPGVGSFGEGISIAAAASCDIGEKVCNNKCIPYSGNCCLGGGYCELGKTCTTTGCCSVGKVKCYDGCMPAGSVCCSGGGYCDAGEYCTLDDKCRKAGGSGTGSGTGTGQCNVGQVPCENRCMPAGAVCCSGGGHCDAGEYCTLDNKCRKAGGSGTGSGTGTGQCDVGRVPCGDSCMPAGSVCCFDRDGGYCDAGATCQPGGCCPFGKVCCPSGGYCDAGEICTTNDKCRKISGSGGGGGVERSTTSNRLSRTATPVVRTTALVDDPPQPTQDSPATSSATSTTSSTTSSTLSSSTTPSTSTRIQFGIETDATQTPINTPAIEVSDETSIFATQASPTATLFGNGGFSAATGWRGRLSGTFLAVMTAVVWAVAIMLW